MPFCIHVVYSVRRRLPNFSDDKSGLIFIVWRLAMMAFAALFDLGYAVVLSWLIISIPLFSNAGALMNSAKVSLSRQTLRSAAKMEE